MCQLITFFLVIWAFGQTITSVNLFMYQPKHVTDLAQCCEQVTTTKTVPACSDSTNMLISGIRQRLLRPPEAPAFPPRCVSRAQSALKLIWDQHLFSQLIDRVRCDAIDLHKLQRKYQPESSYICHLFFLILQNMSKRKGSTRRAEIFQKRKTLHVLDDLYHFFTRMI